MKKILLVSAFIFLLSNLLNAQSYTANWYFGVNAAIRFTGSGPVVYNGSLNTNEGCSVASDTNGAIMFYTNGVTIWDRRDSVMVNGDSLLGGISSTQSALVVPDPANGKQYYVFTVDEIGGSNGFRYSVVDMNQNNGLGMVVAKNVFVQSNVTEKLTGVKQLGSNNYWIVVHDWGTDAFYSYQLTAMGLQPVPVISNTGAVHNTSVIQNTYGQMKFNTCGTRLALAIGYQDLIEVFDFDPVTGVVSNPVTLPMNDHVYGIEFSKDGNLLYASCYDPSETLVQFDLTQATQHAILASKIPLSTTSSTYALQIAVDGKIYVCKSFSQYLGVIDNPNVQGISCNYIDQGLDLDPNFMGISAALGLPGFVQSAFTSETDCATGIDEVPGFDFFTIYPNPSSESFNLKINSDFNSTFKVRVTDVAGRLTEEFNLPKLCRVWYFGKDYAKGTYIFSLSNKIALKYYKIIKL